MWWSKRLGVPQAWEWTIDMVRKGGTVNFFGGCANGTTVALDTQRLHYNELTLKATFHHTPETVRKAFSLICERKIKGTDYITGEAPLSRLQQVLRHMLNRNGDIKTAIIPRDVRGGCRLSVASQNTPWELHRVFAAPQPDQPYVPDRTFDHRAAHGNQRLLSGAAT